MAGKKKKKGGKGKKKGEGGLPPPPNLDKAREGAAEALLNFHIRGKEEAVNVYEEEADTYKQKNYDQSERNYQLKDHQSKTYQALVKGAKELQEGIDQAEKVERDRIDAELKEMFELKKQFESQETELRAKIKATDEEYKTVMEEVEKWKFYRSDVRTERSAHITNIVEEMESFKEKERSLKDELNIVLKKTKSDADQKCLSLKEDCRHRGIKQAMNKIDQETISEYCDKKWLENQIEIMQKMVDKQREEIDGLERRNIKFISTISEAQSKELQAMSDLYSVSTGRGPRSRQTTVESGLPSLVDVTKCTSDQVVGRIGKYEMQLLSVKGSRPPMHVTPETVHLPPIEQQRSCHNALPPRTQWPISNAMLSSLLDAK